MTSPAPTPALRFRFRPGRPLVAAAAGVVGAGLVATSLIDTPVSGGALTIGLGAIGVAFALVYFLSPAWRTEVMVDDEALEVTTAGQRRFRLPWPDVVRVVAASDGATAFVDGGEPGRSLLLPGRGARAPYRIADQARLYEQILARVPADRVSRVDRLGRAASAEDPEARERGEGGEG